MVSVSVIDCFVYFSDSGTKLSYHGGDSSSKLSYGGDSSSKLSFSGESYHGGDTSGQIGTYGSFRGQYSAGQSFDDTKKSLDDQLKELDSQLDSQLLSKVSFPSQVGQLSALIIISPLMVNLNGLLSTGIFSSFIKVPEYLEVVLFECVEGSPDYIRLIGHPWSLHIQTK